MEPTDTASFAQDFSHLPLVPEGANKYEILGTPNDATPEELKLAYRRLALLYHPDRHVEADRELAGEVFKRITVAYRTLSDPQERRRYDLSLQRHETFHEKGGEDTAVTLADILAEIDNYDHIFESEDLPDIDATLRDIIGKSLNQELREQVVSTWPMKSAPPGATFRGSYQKGEVVLTNLRILLPFTFAWQETSGNTRYHYKGAAMPVVVLPTVKQFTIVSKGKLLRSTYVEIEHSDGITQFKPAKQNLCKLLLIARLWGIKVSTQEMEIRKQEVRWALINPWKWAVGLLTVAFVLAGFVGLFAGGVIDNPRDMAIFFTDKGVWQWLFLGTSVLSAIRLCRWIIASGRMDLVASLVNGKPAEDRNAAESASTMAVHPTAV